MHLKEVAQTLIYIHAALGGIALLSGAIAIGAKKGMQLHRKAGKVFYFSMLSAATIALLIAVMPEHQSPFLFSIGLFSSYFLVSGYRSLQFKGTAFNLKWDRIMAYAIILVGIAMIVYPLVIYGKMNIILLVFGIASIYFGISDCMAFRNIKTLRVRRLQIHAGKMTGGYIAAVTAFFVVNNILPGIWNWFVPGLVGSLYIFYWSNKLNPSNS